MLGLQHGDSHISLTYSLFSMSSLIDRKCANIQNWDITNINRHLLTWEYSSYCINSLSSLPFVMLKDCDIINLSYNSSFSCKCYSTAVSLSDYSHLEQLETCKLTFKEHEVVCKNNVGSNLENFSDCDYYDNHVFHRLLKSPFINVNKTSSIVHTNISSMSKNIENIEILIQFVNFIFDVHA